MHRTPLVGGEQQARPNLVFAAGTVFVAGEVMAGVDETIFILAAHNHQYAIAHFVNVVGHDDELSTLFGPALFSLSPGLAVLTKSALPQWLGIVALVLGVVTVLGTIGSLATLGVAICCDRLCRRVEVTGHRPRVVNS